jgi:2,4-dienoyl-CoA reductase-like NADH-dependent reductase (Old Yellow Enzyme family)/thioredoxin reductase
MRFDNLLAPGRIGSLELRNRIVHAPMSLGLGAGDGTCGQRFIDYYAARARGGAGLINIGTVSVGYPYGSVDARQIAISDDAYLPSIRARADAVHAHGARIVLQLNHNGLMAGLDRAQGRPLSCPSLPVAKPSELGAAYLPEELQELAAAAAGTPEATFRELDEAGIQEIVALFAAAAERARRAGVDAVEIHGGHGYILSSFLSPWANQRTDRYGGSLENRARMLLEVIAAVRAAVGRDYPVWCKIDSQEFFQDEGISLEDARQTALWAEAAGADAVSVSAFYDGSRAAAHTSAHTPQTPELLVPNAAAIKAALRIPVITAGRISAETADRQIGEGLYDFVAMGRNLLADPDLPAKLSAGRRPAVRDCIYCYSCISQAYFRRPVLCAVNPEMGHEGDAADRPSRAPRRIVVVGGGPAGLESARRLAGRGHAVTLVERSSTLGGDLRAAAVAYPENRPLLEWLTGAVAAAGIELRLGSEATADLVRGLNPDIVVAATGARAVPAPLPGMELPHVLAGRVLSRWLRKDGTLPGRRAVVVGGDGNGLQLAAYLARAGLEVSVVEAAPKVGAGLAIVRRLGVLEELKRLQVPLLAGARDIAVTPAGVRYVNRHGQARTLGAEHVLVTAGATADPGPAEALRAAGFDVRAVGDCTGIGYIEGAFAAAAGLAAELG